MHNSQRWAAVLAGGEGLRLQSLTTSLTGDRRPKQYCKLLGAHTLLGETRERLTGAVAIEQTVVVVTKAHERYYDEELADLTPERIVAQPANRGTLAAVAFTLARLRANGATGVVGFFPCDHQYRNVSLFCQSVTMAYWHAERNPTQVLLVGAGATAPETDCGWIEPGVVIPDQARATGLCASLRMVQRFVEKPTFSTARSLLERGCLWNTMIVIGHIDALEALIVEAQPHMKQVLTALSVASAQRHDRSLERIYQQLPRADFSTDALAALPERLLVMAVPDLGWRSLGRPEQVAEVLAERDHVLFGSPMAG